MCPHVGSKVFCLDAESITIWKDVPGVLTADPRLFENVIKVDRLSYKEAIEMTYYGAKVIHPKTIQPLRDKGIPMEVRSFKTPEKTGSTVSAKIQEDYPPITVIIDDLQWLRFTSKDLSFIVEEHLSALFQQFDESRVKIHFMKNLATSFSICIDHEPHRLKPLLLDLNLDLFYQELLVWQ